MRHGDRPHERERPHGDEREDDELEDGARPESGDQCRQERCQCERAREEGQREDLNPHQGRSDDQPDRPPGHTHSILADPRQRPFVL
jgi:hypothetical protein